MNLVQSHFVFSTCCREHPFLLVKRLHGGFTEASWRLHGSIARLHEASRGFTRLHEASRGFTEASRGFTEASRMLHQKEFAVSGRARVVG